MHLIGLIPCVQTQGFTANVHIFFNVVANYNSVFIYHYLQWGFGVAHSASQWRIL